MGIIILAAKGAENSLFILAIIAFIVTAFWIIERLHKSESDRNRQKALWYENFLKEVRKKGHPLVTFDKRAGSYFHISEEIQRKVLGMNDRQFEVYMVGLWSQFGLKKERIRKSKYGEEIKRAMTAQLRKETQLSPEI